MSVIHNEQTKLLANALDRASTACLTVGVLAPIAAALYAASGVFTMSAIVIASPLVWIFAAVVLHMSARRILRSLL